MTDVKTEDVETTSKEDEIKVASKDVKSDGSEPDDIQLKRDMLPSVFTNVGEMISIKAELVYIKETGVIHIIAKEGTIDGDKLDTLGIKAIEFVFSIPNYDEILTYRSRCSVANGSSGKMIVDPNKLRYFFILKHLRSWDLEDENGEAIELKFDEDTETLTPESVKLVNGVNPKILDGIFTLLEAEITV